MCVCVLMFVHTYIHVCFYLHMYAYMFVCIYICIYIHTCTFMCAYICIDIYIYVYLSIFIFIHILYACVYCHEGSICFPPFKPRQPKKNMDHAASLQRWAPAPGSEGDHHEECRPEPAPRPNGFKNGKVGRLGIQKVVARGAQAR